MFKKCLAPLTAAGMTLGLMAGPAQAQSAPLALTLPSAMPLVAVGAARIDCGTVPVAVNRYRPARTSKSAAILGGQMSALERMRMQQNQAGAAATTSPASLAPALPVAGSALPVAAVGFTCPSASIEAAPATGSVTMRREGAFLGTERVRIGRTRFDAQWKRVSDASLSQRELSNALGAVPAERGALLARVNRWVNREIAYKSDGGRDNWASASTTLRKRAGDCEDYAILKLQMLAAAGVKQDDMMLTLARDTLRRIDHAVLLVKHEGDWVMLDMQSDRVAPATGHYGYKPVLSFAGNARYLHGQRYQPPVERGPRRLALAD